MAFSKVMMVSKALRLSALILLSCFALAQSAPQAKPAPQDTPVQPPAKQAPGAPPQSNGNPAAPKTDSTAQPSRNTADQKPDRAAAYYHFTLAHMYEEMASMYNRSEDASKAISEYRLAIEADPRNETLNNGLAELYFKTGRIRDAVEESKEIVKRDPSNIDARKLLGRIYLRSLGDAQSGTQSEEMLKLAIEQFSEIARLNPSDVDTHLLLGRLYIINKDLGKAEGEFKAALAAQPYSEEAVSNLAYLYSEQGDNKSALDIIKSVPETQRGPKLFQLLGQAYEQQKDYKKAVDAYQKAVDQDPDNLDIQRGLAQNLLNDGQVEPALAAYKKIAQNDPQDPQAYIRMGEIYRHMGKYDLALENLKKAESLGPQDSLEIPYDEATVYEAQNKYDEAIQLLSGLVEKSMKPGGSYSSAEANNRALFLERLGTVYKESNKPQLAAETFRKMMDLGKENQERAYQELIDLYRDQRQWQQATAAAEEGVQKVPDSKPLKLVLAGQLADTGQADKGIAQLKAQLKGTADDRDVYLALAQVNVRLRRWQDAEQAIDQAAKLSTKPEDKQYLDYLRGNMYERQKRYPEAEEQFKKVLAADPKNSMALNYLGYMLVDRGTRLEEGLNYIKKALEIDPGNPAYLDSLGWAYYKLGNNDLAEENLRKAIEKMGNDGTVQDHLAEVYAHTGRLKQAATHWERALEEWSRSDAPDVDQSDVARVQKRLETTKVKLAKEGGVQKQ